MGASTLAIDTIPWGRWPEAWRIRRNGVELVVVGEIGPRIMSLRRGDGPNILHVDEELAVRRGDWTFYGGSRFWVSPETEASYHAENARCSVVVDAAGITLAAPAEPSGLRRSLRIAAGDGDEDFRITYRLANQGEMIARGGIWVLSCIRGPGRLVCPWDDGTDAWSTQMIRFWRRWSTFGTDVASPQWHLGNGMLVIEPTGEVGKVGLFSKHGLLALVRPDGTFAKYARPMPGLTYPDGGCNLEICTTPNFIEMETLGPVMDLLPGDSIEHEERWLWTADRFEPNQWPDVLRRLGVSPQTSVSPNTEEQQ